MKTITKLMEQLRSNGLRVTPQRRLIIELLVKNESHPTVDDLFQQIKPKMPELSLATVYNTLHELVAMGELREVEGLAGGSTRYDTNTGEHHHLYCEKCHQLVDIEGDLGFVRFPEDENSNYLIHRSQITFYGICPDCQKELS